MEERLIARIVNDRVSEAADIEQGLLLAKITAGDQADNVFPRSALLVVMRGKAGNGADLPGGKPIDLPVNVCNRIAALQDIDELHAVVKMLFYADRCFVRDQKHVVPIPIIFVSIHGTPALPLLFV